MTDGVLEAIVRRHLPGQPPGHAIEPGRRLAELGLTSLRAIDLVLDLEDELDLVFPDELLTDETFMTLASLDAVVGRLRLREGAA